MGRAIAVRTDNTSGEVRRVAQRVKNAAQARRLLAIAAVLDGASRADQRKNPANWSFVARSQHRGSGHLPRR